jgi:hypothetical protein
LSTVLSPLYDSWLERILGGPLPRESKATCSACVMLPTAVDPASPASKEAGVASPLPGHPAFFNPRTKCCTYIPTLANFLVGNLVASTDPALARGQTSVRLRLAHGVGATPLGLAKPRVHSLLYDSSAVSFGKAERLRCPHYIDEGGGLCGIWRYSSAICSTWYCKYDQGGRGSSFWATVRDLLLLVERRLSLWSLLSLGLDPDQLHYLLGLQSQEGGLQPEDLDERCDREAYRRAWGSYMGRELELYQACADQVNRLSWEQVRTVCGPEVSVLERSLLASQGKLRALPERLKQGTYRIVHSDQSAYYLETYSAFDPLRVARVMVDSLHLFDGTRTNAEVLARLAEEWALRVDPSVVERLVDYQVLVAADA